LASGILATSRTERRKALERGDIDAVVVRRLDQCSLDLNFLSLERIGRETGPYILEMRKVVQSDLRSLSLELRVYGPSNIDVRIVKHASPKDDPSYIWSGSSPEPWALTLRDKKNYVDLSGPVAKIRWRTKQAGFNLLRPVLKLADGTFLVGDYTEGYTGDWRETEFSLASVRWRSLDSANIVTTRSEPGWVVNPDLTRVDEVGFTDLVRGSGGGAGGGSRIDWIEVYGNPVPR
jgi:hypothetical protein